MNTTVVRTFKDSTPIETLSTGDLVEAGIVFFSTAKTKQNNVNE